MKISIFSKVLVCGAVIASLTSCGNNDKSGTSIDASSIANDASLTKEEKSERLAKAAEQLLTAQGFAYASDVADLSLQTDSSNVRAQFVKAVLAPIMAHKGLYKRVKPLADRDVEATEKYAKAIAEFDENFPNSTIKEFLLDGQEDIKTEADVQGYLDSVADSFKTIREFAKANKNSELTVMASDALYKAMEQRYIKACEVKLVGYYKYETNCPDIKNLMEVSLNRADFEAIQQMAAGYELYFSLANSYNLTGSIDKAVASKGQEEDGRKVLEDLLKNRDFATLRTGNGFQKVKAMGIDAIAGVRWIMKNQNTLCPMGSSNPRNRLGMLISNGICSKKENAVEDSKNISLASDILAGKIIENVEIGRKESWEYVNGSWKHVVKPGYITSVKPVSIFETPIADLRDVNPTAYDKCGNAVSIKDASVAGIFVKSDANSVLAQLAECK